jgi:hypothetical protein
VIVAVDQMLAVTSGRMRDLVKTGRSLDEVLAAMPNADYNGQLAWSLTTVERFIQILYRHAVRELSPGRT